MTCWNNRDVRRVTSTRTILNNLRRRCQILGETIPRISEDCSPQDRSVPKQYARACGEGVIEVVCHHPFGLGLCLPDHDTHGHANIPEVSDVVVHGPGEFPPIGTQVSARVLGPSAGSGQLTLTLRTPATP